MTKDLYFIPILAHALQQSDSKAALRDAFKKIKSMGQQPEYRQGFVQFQRFMDVAVQHAFEQKQNFKDIANRIAQELSIELATGTFEGHEEERKAALDLIMSRPEWQNRYEQLCAEISTAYERVPGIRLVVEKEGKLFGEISFEERPRSVSLGNVVPGHYLIRLETGRVLWDDDLTERDLVWSAAFPGRPLEMAAETEQLRKQPTREVSLLDGELKLRVFPGPEEGRIEIEITDIGVTLER